MLSPGISLPWGARKGCSTQSWQNLLLWWVRIWPKMIGECSGEDKATWGKAVADISCQADRPLVARHPRTTQNGGSLLPSLSHPHLHASSLLPQGSWQGAKHLRGQVKYTPRQHGGEAMAPVRGRCSEERQPPHCSALRGLQLHSVIPSIHLNPFLTIPHFYPFMFNSSPRAILKGWAAAQCLWRQLSGKSCVVPGARKWGRGAGSSWHRPSGTGYLTNWFHAHSIESGACKVKSTQ